MTLRNKHLDGSSHITKEEEIDLREQTKKKMERRRRSRWNRISKF